jgi:hypothetical protein
MPETHTSKEGVMEPVLLIIIIGFGLIFVMSGQGDTQRNGNRILTTSLFILLLMLLLASLNRGILG